MYSTNKDASRLWQYIINPIFYFLKSPDFSRISKLIFNYFIFFGLGTLSLIETDFCARVTEALFNDIQDEEVDPSGIGEDDGDIDYIPENNALDIENDMVFEPNESFDSDEEGGTEEVEASQPPNPTGIFLWQRRGKME